MTPFRRPRLLVSGVLLAALAAAFTLSFWRFAGWQRHEERWVVGGAVQSLHTTDRSLLLMRGRVQFIGTETLSAVIPAGSPAAGPARRESRLLWQPAAPIRERGWESRWHLRAWNEWRLGNLGWYTSSGGGAISRVVSIPLWLLAAIAGLPVWAAAARSLLARGRGRKGRCRQCGYDRRGLGATAPCPECGSAR